MATMILVVWYMNSFMGGRMIVDQANTCSVTPLLVIDCVSKRFTNPKGGASILALDDISFDVFDREYVCILGRSGCGKSTLLGVIAGFIIPDSGRVLCKGQAIEGPDRHRMLMFQESALFPWLDVLGNVLYSLNLVEGITKSEKLERAMMFLEMVGLADFHHLRIHELSGGMKQRTALARALAPDPDILLMDEPFSALDAMTREQFYCDMQRIWNETHKTIIMVTHNVREAVCLGTRVVVMETLGQLVADETVALPFPRGMNDVSLTAAAAQISNLVRIGSNNGAANGVRT